MKLKVPPVIVMAITVFLMWVIEKYLPVEFLAFNAPKWIIILTSILGIACIVLGVIQFSVKKTTVNPHKPEDSTSLVSSGIYSISRNPMYLGMAILLLAETVYLGSLFGPLWIIGFMLFINQFQIKPEEKALRDLFGSAFEEYCRRTRRWL